jgi:hypothetical protein
MDPGGPNRPRTEKRARGPSIPSEPVHIFFLSPADRWDPPIIFHLRPETRWWPFPPRSNPLPLFNSRKCPAVSSPRRTYKSPTSPLQFPSFPRAREAARLWRLHARAPPSARPQTTNSSGSESPASSFWPQTLSLSPVHPLMSFPYSNSQQNKHVDDTRGRHRLQPPSGIATGRVRRHRSNSRVRHTLPHLVRVFLTTANHRSELAVDHQCRTSPENCPTGESPSQICSHPLDLESNARIKSLTQKGMLRSEPSRSL